MKVNNPDAVHGKMRIRYKGNNELLINHPDEMKRIYMHRSKEIMPEVYENLIIETKLFDGTNVCFSLCSSHLYNNLSINNKKTWVRYGREGEEDEMEENYGVHHYANIDNEQVIFEGNIVFHQEISPEFVSYESYDFLLFFNYTKDLLELLNKNKIDYLYHSYSKSGLQDEI